MIFELALSMIHKHDWSPKELKYDEWYDYKRCYDITFLNDKIGYMNIIPRLFIILFCSKNKVWMLLLNFNRIKSCAKNRLCLIYNWNWHTLTTLKR